MTAPPTAPPTPATGLIAGLVGIRGVLSWIVVLVHVSPLAATLTPVAAPVWGYVGHHFFWALDFFFILSGYVITSGYHRRFVNWPGGATFGRFLWARLSRFYPVHLAVLAALVGAVLVSRAAGAEIAHGGDLGGDLARNVLLLQGWGGADSLTWNGPSWSVSAEWFCYLIMPLVLPLVVRIRTSTGLLVCYAASMAVMLGAYAVLGSGDPQITYEAPLWRAVTEFVAGAVLCRLGHLGSRIPGWLGRVTGPLVVALAVLVAVLSVARVTLLWVVPLAGLIVAALAQQRGIVDRVLRMRAPMAGGELSVALYLTHVPVLLAAALVVTPDRFPGGWGWLGLGLVLAGTVAVAKVVHRLVEVPAHRFMTRLVPPRPRTNAS